MPALTVCPVCNERSQALDGASLPSERGLCELCRQRARNRAGVCPNCAGALVSEPIINALTGKPRRGPAPQRNIQTQRRCLACGRATRERG